MHFIWWESEKGMNGRLPLKRDMDYLNGLLCLSDSATHRRLGNASLTMCWQMMNLLLTLTTFSYTEKLLKKSKNEQYDAYNASKKLDYLLNWADVNFMFRKSISWAFESHQKEERFNSNDHGLADPEKNQGRSSLHRNHRILLPVRRQVFTHHTTPDGFNMLYSRTSSGETKQPSEPVS